MPPMGTYRNVQYRTRILPLTRVSNGRFFEISGKRVSSVHTEVVVDSVNFVGRDKFSFHDDDVSQMVRRGR